MPRKRKGGKGKKSISTAKTNTKQADSQVVVDQDHVNVENNMGISALNSGLDSKQPSLNKNSVEGKMTTRSQSQMNKIQNKDTGSTQGSNVSPSVCLSTGEGEKEGASPMKISASNTESESSTPNSQNSGASNEAISQSSSQASSQNSQHSGQATTSTSFDSSAEFRAMIESSQQLFGRLDAAVKAVNTLTTEREDLKNECQDLQKLRAGIHNDIERLVENRLAENKNNSSVNENNTNEKVNVENEGGEHEKKSHKKSGHKKNHKKDKRKNGKKNRGKGNDFDQSVFADLVQQVMTKRRDLQNLNAESSDDGESDNEDNSSSSSSSSSEGDSDSSSSSESSSESSDYSDEDDSDSQSESDVPFKRRRGKNKKNKKHKLKSGVLRKAHTV